MNPQARCMSRQRGCLSLGCLVPRSRARARRCRALSDPAILWKTKTSAERIRRMRGRLVFLFGTILVTSLGAETLDEALRAMTTAERKLYQTGQEKGPRAAFLEFLAEHAIVFRPGPVNGRDTWNKRAETGF